MARKKTAHMAPAGRTARERTRTKLLVEAASSRSSNGAPQTIGGYLRLRADRDFVMVIVGDHQPPAMVSGEEATWDVPVHVITSRPQVLDRLLRQGFSEGLRPHGPAIKIHALLPNLLDAFNGE